MLPCISIHALLAESDGLTTKKLTGLRRFLSTLSLRRATMLFIVLILFTIFLSTLSLRRATFLSISKVWEARYFYPRSPCGERPQAIRVKVVLLPISIHALLAESDLSIPITGFLARVFLSTLSLRRATSYLEFIKSSNRYFYPRSPCGERRFWACPAGCVC